jgi:acyl-coenzyme A thioesterase PaaI-like protein
MRRVLPYLKPSPALAVALAALLAASTGWAIAATSSSPVIRACANKKTGALRLAGKCHRNERHVSWNQIGPKGSTGARGAAGPRGLTGATGASGGTGTQGKEGPQGPGAISFDTTITEETTLAAANGIHAVGFCNSAKKEVAVSVQTATGKNNFQASGTAAEGTALTAIDSTGGFAISKHSPTTADADVVAADSTIGKTVRVDIHGEFLEPACRVWGIAIPSS